GNMPVTLGIDLGTTTIAALALDTDSGAVVAHSAHPNDAEITSSTDKARGYSEWDAMRVAGIGLDCLGDVRKQIDDGVNEIVGIGITGQQHGVVIPPNWCLSPTGQTLMPPIPRLIGWQDRRGEELIPGTEEAFVARARRLAGNDAATCTGCRL